MLVDGIDYYVNQIKMLKLERSFKLGKSIK